MAKGYWLWNEPEHHTQFQGETLNHNRLLSIYFYVFYYIGITPFQIKYDKCNQKFNITTTVIQKIICIFTSLFPLVNLGTWLDYIITNDSGSKNTLYYDLSQWYGCFILYSSFEFTLWKKSIQIVQLANSFEKYKFCRYDFPVLSRMKYFGTFLALSGLTFPIILLCRAFEESSLTFIDGLDSKSEDVLNLLRRLTFYKLNLTVSSEFWRYSLGLFHLVAEYYCATAVTAGRLLLVFTTISMYISLKTFGKKLENEYSISEIFYQYVQLKSLSKVTAESTSRIAFGVVYGSIPQMIYGILSLLQPQGIITVIWNMFEVSITLSSVLLAVIVRLQVHSVFQELLANRDEMDVISESDEDKKYLRMLRYKISLREIGLEGNRLSKLSSTFIAGVIRMAIKMTVVLITSNIVQRK